MANNKKTTYMTVDQIRKQERENRFKNLKFDDDKVYSVDEIRQAAIDQGLIEAPKPTVEPPTVNESGRQSAERRNPLDLRNMVQHTNNDTIPRIAQEAVRNYNTSRVGSDYLSKYDDSTSYTDVQNDIESLQNIRGGAKRRGRDTASYDRAIEMLKSYASQNYSLDDTSLSLEDRNAIYKQNKQDIADLSGEGNDEYTRDYSLMRWLGMYDKNAVSSDEANQTAIDLINKDNVKYDVSLDVGGLSDEEKKQKAEELRTYFQDKYGYGFNTDYLTAASEFYKSKKSRYDNAKVDNEAYERLGQASAVTSDINKKDDYEQNSVAGDYGTPTSREEVNEYITNANNARIAAIDDPTQKLLEQSANRSNDLPDKLGSFFAVEKEEIAETPNTYVQLRKDYAGSGFAVDTYDRTPYTMLQTEGYKNHWDVMTNEEVGAYYYLLNTEGKDAAYEYLDSLTNTLQKRANYENKKTEMEISGEEGTITNLDWLVRNASTVPDKVAGGIAGYIDNVSHYIAGEDIEPYSNIHGASLSATATREAAGETLDKKAGAEDANRWAVKPSQLYQGVMSAADMATAMIVGPEVYGASMGMSAAEDTARDLWEQGEDNDTINALSTAAGTAEMLFEELSLDKIIKISNLAGESTAKGLVKNYLLNMVKSSGIEASEEVLTEAANMVVDYAVRGDRSDEAGYSFADVANRLYQAGVGGAIGGLLGGGGATTLSATAKSAELIQNQSERNKYIAAVGSKVVGAGNTQELIDQAKAVEGDSKAAQRIRNKAEKLEQRTEKSGNTKKTFNETGKLYTSMQENNISRVASAEETEIKTALSKAYAERIKADVNDKSVSKVVNALYKSEYTDEPLTLSERRIVTTNQKAKAALSDVQSNEDVIRSQINRAQRRATEDIASTAALTGTKEQAAEKPAKIDIDDFNLSDDGKTYTADGGEQVDIKSISSVDADDIRVELSNGNTESVKALDLGSEDQAVVYQGIMDIQTRLGAPVTASFANAVVNEYNQAKASDANLSTTDFIYGVEEAVRKGYMNDNGGNYAVNLSESAREALFNEGRKIAQEHTKAQQKSVQSRIKGNNSQRKGTVTYEDGIERSKLNERQQVGVDVVTHIAEETGIDVVFFRSTKDGKGRFSSDFYKRYAAEKNIKAGTAPNGFWSDSKIYIDVNAGMNGEGLILFTAAHEIVHMIREGSPESFKALADFLVENYAKKGVDVNKLVLKEMTRSTNLNYDAAYEEVIAQSCESFLRDIHLSDKAEQLYKTDKGLATKIKNILNRILNALKKWYGVAKPQSVEANYVLEMKDALSEAYDKYIAGIRAASENLRNMEKPADDGGAKLQARSGSSAFNENAVSTAIWEALDHADKHHDNLIKVSEMPQYVQSLLGISGDFYVQRNHTYENTVSEERAKEEGRFSDKAHYHNYGVEKMERALLAIEHPIMTIVAPRTNDGNPTVIMLLDEFGHNDAPMYAVLSFYSNKMINGSNAIKPHVVLTIAERDWYATKGRTGYDEIVESAIKQGRVIDFDKNKRADLTEVAQTTSLGSITVSSLEHNLSQFKKEINSFKAKNKISYQSRSSTDSDYLSAVERGDMDTAQRMVDEAAKAAGYNTPMLYHGTQNFGFTQFDLNKMDDGMSIFLTSTEETASTYSGRTGVKRINEKLAGDKYIDDMSPQQLVEALNKNKGASQFDTEYKTLSLDEINDMADSTEKVLRSLEKYAKNVKPKYVATADTNEDAYYIDLHIHNLVKHINENDYFGIMNHLRPLSEQAEEFDKPEYKQLYDTLHLLFSISGEVRYASNGYVYYVDVDDGMMYQPRTEESLKYFLKSASNFGNYATYAKLDNPLVIDAKGANWNRIPVPYDIWWDLARTDRGMNYADETPTSYTRAIAGYAKEHDYDGVIFKNLEDNGGENDYVHHPKSDVYVVFDSAQVKSADPVTYDDNGDVIPLSERFNESNKDIRFSLRDNVEETRDLIAVHNLTEEKLLKSLRLGGLPMPSVAVIKAENGHKGYGDISIVFPKETIDPSENRNNKLYGGDVWSPTYPSIDYEVDTKKANKIYTRAREALRKPAAYRLNPVTFHPENIADRINSYGGEQGFIEHYKNDYGMKQFYLAEQDQAVPERYVEKRNEISDVDKEFYSFLADQLGKEAFSQEATKTGREWNNRYADDLDNARIDYMRSVYGELSKEEEENLRRDFESERPVHKFRIAMSVQGYLENGGVTVERKLDEDGIKADIDKLVDQSKYEEWLKELFNGIEKSSGIYNGTDYYTSSGNRRSFAQTHYTETLANVVRVMKSQDNGDSFFGGNGLWAIAAKNYGTIEEMKADKDRLTNLSDEERQEISNRFGERFTEIASSIANDGDNEFLALDNAYGNICDAVRNTNTKSGLLRELQKYHHKATVATVDDILDLVSDVGNMPVNYFEAKPQRAIKFNEVSTAVIPDNASQALRTALDKAGVKYVEYASGNEEARTEILNSLEDVKFQSRDNDLYFGETDDAFDIDFGEDDSVENLIAREFVTHHEDMGEVLRNVADIELTPKKVESIVNRVIRDNLGRLDAEARHTLSIELQMALERINSDDAQSVSDEIIGAVRKAIEGSTVVDDKAVSDYNQLRDVFKGKKFYLTDEQVNQLKEHDMTLDSYRRAMRGKVTIVKRENAKRSISGGYADANELSLMGLHDVLESPDEILGFRSWEWDEKGYDAPNIIKEAFETLRDRREQPITNVYSDEAIDERAVAIAAKITGGIVEAKYNSKQNPYVTKLVADLKQKRTEAVNKQKEKNRQKLAELKQKERERAEKREQDIRQKYREQRARGNENRKRTELRGKIRKLMNSFQSRLTKPHDGSYVPRELISQTVEILNSINMDTGRSTNLSEKIAALRNTYDGLKEDAQAYAVYDDTISAMLRGLSESLGDTSIMNMSLEQLKQTYDTLRSLDHYIRESVKMTDTDEKRTAHQLGREMIAETKDVPKEHSGLLSGYIQTQLRADVMFNRLAGFKKNSTWSQMARMLNDGQLHMTQLQMEFSRIFADVLTDTKQLRTLSDTKHLVDIGLVDDDGNKVPITRGMMLSLYMHLLNEDNMRHVERGGLTIPSMKEYYKGDLAKAFGSGQRSVRVGMIDFSQYAEGIKTVIEEQLTDYEIEWIEKAHEFFDGASREALNDTTMKLYHFKKANVDNYFPIHTDSNYRAASFESITRDMSLENSGFMKERIKASNPILLEDIVDVINDQIQKVSKYCGLTIPIKNFQKVYGTTLAGFETSLQKEINKKFSGSRSNTSATKYIDNLITDLTSGRQTSDGPFAKFFSVARGNLAAATLTLNVRVAIAQAASYPTAAAEIGWKPLLKAFVKGGKNNRMISGADRAYIEEHTPLLWLRTQGYSNTEIGDIKEIRKQRHQIEGKFKKAMGWIEFFDGMTVGRLFYAAQYYVDEQFPTLKRGSEEYKQKVAEVYNDVIEKTQPNYTTMQRPDILRNPNALVKSMTMFMTQRLQNFNIVYDAVGTYNKYRKDLTAGKNGVTAQDLRQAKTKLRRALVSQTVAALTIVGMKLFADMLMHSMNAYRDDDDELTAESVSLALLNNFADTIFGSVLFGSDLYSLLKSAISGERYYGISLSGVDSFTDAVEKIVNLRKGIDLDSANKAATAICQLMGIPLNNAEKIGKAIYNWGSDFSSGSFMEAGVERTNKQNVHRAEMRYTSGDTAGAQELLTAMIEQKKAEGKTDKEAKSWLRSQLTSTYKPRYVQAVKDNNTEERTAIRQFLYQSGAYGSLTDLDKTLSKWVDK